MSDVNRQDRSVVDRCPGDLALQRRRGTVLVAVVLLLLILEIFVAGLVAAAPRDQHLGVDRLDTVRSFYSAEAAMNMAVRELMIAADEDGDGAIGSISDDGNDATDPQLNQGSLVVSAAIVGSDTVLTSEGRSGNASRRLQATVSSN